MKIQSNGMGQQSVALYLMSSLGEIERFDYSIFADPGAEKTETYQYLYYLIDWQIKNNGVPLIWNKDKNLYEDILSGTNSTGHRFASIPAFSENGGMIRRQCTHEYKIIPVNNSIRKLQGKKKGQSFDEVRIYFGISIDEMDRMFSPKRKNVIHVYPFCGYEFHSNKIVKTNHEPKTRSQLRTWLNERGHKIPPKSSCVFCPFQKNADWKELKNNHEDFNKAVKIDYAMRDMSKQGMDNKIYLHRSLKPIDKVKLNENQIEINYDCFGYCGI
jgi:hypothetical protein